MKLSKIGTSMTLAVGDIAELLITLFTFLTAVLLFKQAKQDKPIITEIDRDFDDGVFMVRIANGSSKLMILKEIIVKKPGLLKRQNSRCTIFWDFPEDNETEQTAEGAMRGFTKKVSTIKREAIIYIESDDFDDNTAYKMKIKTNLGVCTKYIPQGDSNQ